MNGCTYLGARRANRAKLRQQEGSDGSRLCVEVYRLSHYVRHGITYSYCMGANILAAVERCMLAGPAISDCTPLRCAIIH